LGIFDFHCPLLSLPLAFDSKLESIPAEIPYLTAPRDRIDRWHKRLAPSSVVPGIGLVWSGSARNANDRNRSIGLAQLIPLVAQAGVQFVSLQQELRDDDAGILSNHPIIHLGGELRDFADTASVVSQLDLVITVDTAVAHLAGALGKPVWILLPFAPDWRWMLDREDSPWYPTARLFRQPAIGDWGSVVERVGRELRARYGTK
jgi:ADP-heptose:LPS heptosyltransferase